jgi:stearoyl-CoA desaturase (delta-9 desaturase)
LDLVLDFLLNGITHATGWQILLFTLAVTHITIAGVTIFLHRCQAHRALDLHAIPSHFFRFWLWMTTGMVTKEWAAIHRKHHAKCETVEDPHSPITRGIETVVFEGAELYRIEAKNRETIEKYGHGTPDDWIERNVYTKHSALGVSLMLVINVMLFGVLGLTVWAIQMAWIPVTAAGVINGIGHYWGYRNFECKDASTNILPIGIIIGGEELHNNQPKFDSSKSVADLDTLHAVVANRYDVMAKYARSLRSAWRDEVDQIRASSALESGFLRSSKKLLQQEPTSLETSQKQQLSELFEHSKALKTMHEMRVELGAIWERSHFTSDQLLQQLRDWCARAEASGIRSLREFSLRLRTYA